MRSEFSSFISLPPLHSNTLLTGLPLLSSFTQTAPPAQKAARSFFICCTPASSPRWSTEPSSVKERLGGLISWLTSHRLHALWEARTMPCSACNPAPSTRLSTKHTLHTSVLTQWVHRKGLLFFKKFLNIFLKVYFIFQIYRKIKKTVQSFHIICIRFSLLLASYVSMALLL